MSPRFSKASNSSAEISRASTSAVTAASVGAKTVNGPSALKASTKPAAPTAASSNSWSGLLTITSTTVVVGGAGGNNTASITCTTPLSAVRSATVTWASLMNTPSMVMLTVTSGPRRVSIIWPSDKSPLMASPATTWYCKMAPRSSEANRSSGVISRASTTAVMAASVGANTVNGPSADKASARPAAPTAVASNVWSGLPAMTSTTVVVIGAGFTTMEATMPWAAWLPMLQS